MIILDFIVRVFSDIIFLGIWGWLINPIYRKIEFAANTAIADSFLILIEFIFYGAVLALIVVLCDKLHKKRRQEKKDKAKLQSQLEEKQKKKEKRQYRDYV